MGASTLFVCAGHGGADKGNTMGKYVERDELIRVVDTMHSLWRGMGIVHGVGGQVTIPHNLNLAGEIPAIQAWKPDLGDLALDIHLDWRGASGGSGAMVIVDETVMGNLWAVEFLERWCRLTGIKKGPIADSKTWAQEVRKWGPGSDMGFCRPRFPGVIVELGCMNSESDMRVIQNPAMIQALGVLIWDTWIKFRSKAVMSGGVKN